MRNRLYVFGILLNLAPSIFADSGSQLLLEEGTLQNPKSLKRVSGKLVKLPEVTINSVVSPLLHPRYIDLTIAVDTAYPNESIENYEFMGTSHIINLDLNRGIRQNSPQIDFTEHFNIQCEGSLSSSTSWSYGSEIAYCKIIPKDGSHLSNDKNARERAIVDLNSRIEQVVDAKLGFTFKQELAKYVTTTTEQNIDIEVQTENLANDIVKSDVFSLSENERVLPQIYATAELVNRLGKDWCGQERQIDFGSGGYFNSKHAGYWYKSRGKWYHAYINANAFCKKVFGSDSILSDEEKVELYKKARLDIAHELHDLIFEEKDERTFNVASGFTNPWKKTYSKSSEETSLSTVKVDDVVEYQPSMVLLQN